MQILRTILLFTIVSPALACDDGSLPPFEVREATIDGAFADCVIELPGKTLHVERLAGPRDVAVVVSDPATHAVFTALAHDGRTTYLDAAFEPLPVASIHPKTEALVETVIDEFPLEGIPLPSFRRMKSHDNCLNLEQVCAQSGGIYDFCGDIQAYC